jgi:histidinol dehydrogenase
MRIVTASNPSLIARLASVDRARDARVRVKVARIVRDVERRGDAALLAWRRKLDGDQSALEVSRRELRAACDRTPRDVRRAIRAAMRQLERVSRRQQPKPFNVSPSRGVRIEHRVTPLERVACYVPGGRHALPSTVVMTVVPARIAGVREILVCCPSPSPAVLCAAVEAGATRVLRMGGAQAIAALALGTRSVPRVDKIVGPGNAWVTAAKDLVAYDGRCAIDFHAGPSEIVILSDDGPASWIAADLIAQAEHDPDARALLVTTRPSLATMVAGEVEALMPANGAAREAIARHGAIIVARHRAEAYTVVRRLSPEHLVVDRARDVAHCGAAGTVFVGRWSAQAAGDYCTGSNHVLPTGGMARARGGLSTADFVRACTVQTLTRRGVHDIAAHAVALAEAEGLSAHAASIRLRTGVS